MDNHKSLYKYCTPPCLHGGENGLYRRFTMNIIASIYFTPFVTAFAAALIAAIVGGSIVIVRIGRCKA